MVVQKFSPKFQSQSRSNNKRMQLEKQLINSVIDFWRREITTEIQDVIRIGNRENIANKLFQIRNNLRVNLMKRIDTHIEKILRLGLREVSVGNIQIPQEKIDDAKALFFSQSNIEQAITIVTQNISAELVRLQGFQFTITSQEEKETIIDTIGKALNTLARKELNAFNNTMRTEATAAINLGRAIEYENRDTLDDFRFVWQSFDDFRRTPQCEEITETVESEANANNEPGVSLSRLKEIIDIVARKHDPNWQLRAFVPHFNCRSSLTRRVI